MSPFRFIRIVLFQFDSLRFASVRFGSVRFVSVRFCSVRFASVRFGYILFGSLCSVRFGWRFWSQSIPLHYIGFGPVWSDLLDSIRDMSESVWLFVRIGFVFDRSRFVFCRNRFGLVGIYSICVVRSQRVFFLQGSCGGLLVFSFVGLLVYFIQLICLPFPILWA